MWWLLAAFGALAAGGMAGKLRRFTRRKTWEKAARSCGFEVVWRSGPKEEPQAIRVRAGQAELRIEDLEGLAAVVVPGPRGVSDVSISHDGYKHLERSEIQTGDELFDSRFWISGPEQFLRGVLDAETRRLLLGLNLDDWVEITRGETWVETSDKNLQSVLPLSLALGRRFARRADVVRLSMNARNDPEAGVRLQNLLLLIREHPGKSSTLVALRKACSDPAPEIRLRAAMASEGDHGDVLVELAESLVDDTVSAEAVSALDRELPFERRRAILGQALERGRVQTARVCLESLGRSGDAAAVDVLAEVLARESGKMAAAAAVALGATGSPAAEPPLLQALQREDTQVAAAGALARTGTAAAVLPLEEAAERTEDKELHRATRQAVAEIQSRLQGASPGQLSLAEGEAGQLSLAPAGPGRRSRAHAEDGHLSLAHAEVPLLPHVTDEPEQPSRNAREKDVRPV